MCPVAFNLTLSGPVLAAGHATSGFVPGALLPERVEQSRGDLVRKLPDLQIEHAVSLHIACWEAD